MVQRKVASDKVNQPRSYWEAINKIVIDDHFNVRRNTSPDEELLASVRENGITNPIHVRLINGDKSTLHLVDGARRLRAAVEAGKEKVLVVDHGNISETEALVLSLTANKSQKKLSKKESFIGFIRLSKEGLTPDQISEVMAVDKRTVIEALKIESKASPTLKAAAKKSIKEGGVTIRAAALASSLPKNMQNKLLPKLAGKNKAEATQVVREAEKEIGVTRVGRKPAGATLKSMSKKPSSKIAEDASDRLVEIERIIRKKLKHNQTHRLLNAQLLVVQCIKGDMTVQDLFGWDA